MCKYSAYRVIVLVLALTILLMTPALAASCTLCGSDTGSDDYLCTDCLLSLLVATKEENPLEITGTVQNADGTVTLSWTDSEGHAPYAVYYELLETASVPFGWTAAAGITDTSLVLDRLVPGVSYVITVADALGQTAETTYFAPIPQEDTEIGAKIRFKAMRRTGRLTKQQESLQRPLPL